MKSNYEFSRRPKQSRVKRVTDRLALKILAGTLLSRKSRKKRWAVRSLLKYWRTWERERKDRLEPVLCSDFVAEGRERRVLTPFSFVIARTPAASSRFLDRVPDEFEAAEEHHENRDEDAPDKVDYCHHCQVNRHEEVRHVVAARLPLRRRGSRRTWSRAGQRIAVTSRHDFYWFINF